MNTGMITSTGEHSYKTVTLRIILLSFFRIKLPWKDPAVAKSLFNLPSTKTMEIPYEHYLNQFKASAKYDHVGVNVTIEDARKGVNKRHAFELQGLRSNKQRYEDEMDRLEAKLKKTRQAWQRNEDNSLRESAAYWNMIEYLDSKDMEPGQVIEIEDDDTDSDNMDVDSPNEE